jgi:hypothetical protein
MTGALISREISLSHTHTHTHRERERERERERDHMQTQGDDKSRREPNPVNTLMVGF